MRPVWMAEKPYLWRMRSMALFSRSSLWADELSISSCLLDSTKFDTPMPIRRIARFSPDSSFFSSLSPVSKMVWSLSVAWLKLWRRVMVVKSAYLSFMVTHLACLPRRRKSAPTRSPR